MSANSVRMVPCEAWAVVLPDGEIASLQLSNNQTAARADTLRYDDARVARVQITEGDSPELAALRAFAQDVIAALPVGGLDGFELQDLAEKHGLLRKEMRTEPCGEVCQCAEFGEFPMECFRKTALLSGPLPAPPATREG